MSGKLLPEKKTDARKRYETEKVSQRLRELRLGRKLTISRLAELSGVPGSTISKIENGQLRPSLVHAINLASALQENLGFLVARFRERPQRRVVVRRATRDTIEYPEMGLVLQDLSGHFLPGVLEARLGTLAPGAHSGVGSMTHQGEEICFVLSGAISYRIDEETYDLSPNEYLHLQSSIPHSWENAVAAETRVLWIFSDGLSF
jgi:transcriptional regulator with XRE-family HTH domain